MYLHFDFDEFIPDLMVSPNAGVYSTWRMIPPGFHQYFFSVNGTEYFTTGSQVMSINEFEALAI